MSTNPYAAMLIGVLIGGSVPGAEQPYRIDHVAVSSRGFPPAYVEAICRTAATARSVAIDQFGFDMPGTIRIDLVCEPNQMVRLFTDGRDHLYLTVRSEKDLHKPSESRVFNLYGICHEIGHLAMYRTIHNRSWLTTGAAEGWAHYVGSRLVDRVYEIEKDELWPDPYDYRADGMARLKKQSAAASPGDTVQAAQWWMQLGDIVGDKGLADVLKRWGSAKVDPYDPARVLRERLRVEDDPRLSPWWDKAETVLVLKQPKSPISARTIDRKSLSGKPVELACDDGNQAGRRSIGGSGHAVRFLVRGDGWYLTGVRIYGSRYGLPAPPGEDFRIWLCDGSFKPIAEFDQPYSRFARGTAGWVALPITPTGVPAEFVLCVAFNPTAQKGIYVGHDARGTGNSFTGTLGREFREFTQGDWMIRAQVDQPSSANALLPPK